MWTKKTFPGGGTTISGGRTPNTGGGTAFRMKLITEYARDVQLVTGTRVHVQLNYNYGVLAMVLKVLLCSYPWPKSNQSLRGAVEFGCSYQLIKSSSKVSFMQSCSRVRHTDCEDWNIVWNNSVEQETDVEPCSGISLRRIYFTVELDPRSINNCWSQQLRRAKRWNMFCTII